VERMPKKSKQGVNGFALM